ncbi:MTAP family purine nucleoside phosphorylase [Capillimicrobium parvum]|uniref:S-methyl-5'-thioadenosine phosphorylase n=1 Tax=Capillimicrobium parvum TaxID=2884022 RepID=A0A9E7BZS6_9ACTN|nr:MTAP family purine nucleoside phosphorylase [Capillimicrobium parvum]UGS34648.1 S-methyl-5'-thioadenosine phosphorylase [Capillimicrobium parvum]
MKVGIITGSGTYALPGFEDAEARTVDTRFGPAPVTTGTWAGVEVVHVSRHGEGHRRLSSSVSHQANVLALKEAGAGCVLAATVCGALDPELELGTLVVFDDLHFLANRLPDGSLCTLYTEPGMPGRGHWIFDRPFAPELRGVLLDAARAAGHPVRDGGCYGHVDGPRFNTRTEIRMLRQAGVTAVSQTAGPETVLCGEAELPYALVGYATDYANGVPDEPTPVQTLIELIGRSGAVFAGTLRAAVGRVPAAGPRPVGTHFRFD